MKVKDLKQWIDTLDSEADIVLARPFVINASEHIMGVVDIPVIGMSYNTVGHTELRLMIGDADAMQGLLPGDLKFTDSCITNELNIIKSLIDIIEHPEHGSNLNSNGIELMSKAHDLVNHMGEHNENS